MVNKDNNKFMLKIALDNADNGILYISFAGEIKYANRKCHNVLGYSIDCLTGINIDDISASDSQNEFISFSKSLEFIGNTEKATFEKKFITNTNEIVACRISSLLVKDSENGTNSFIWYIKDIRNKKDEIGTLLDYERYFARFTSALMQNGPDGIKDCLPFLLQASNSSRVYIFENFIDAENNISIKQTYEACAPGVTPEIDNPVLQHIIYERDGFDRWAKELSNNKIINSIVSNFPKNEIEILEPQGIKSILIIPIWVDQKWYGFIGFDDTNTEKEFSKYDIDLLRSASEIIGLDIENIANKNLLIKNNNKLKEANAMKDRFISILAHDLKSPFNSILGFSQLLARNADNYDNDKIKEFAELINNSTKQTYSLLDNLLEWSRSQRNAISFNPIESNVFLLVEETCLMLKSFAELKNINIALDIPPNLSIEVDKEMFKTVIRNILSNSLKFTEKNGLISISAVYDVGKVKIKISDYGIGMSEMVKNSLFKIDKIVSNTGTAGEKGTGFGLLLCKDFIEKHNGTITVESEKGKGTQIFITLPEYNNLLNKK